MAQDFDFRGLQTKKTEEISTAVKDTSTKKRKELEDFSINVLAQVIENISTENENALVKKEVIGQINKIIESILLEEKRNMSFSDKQKIINYVMDEIFGYGPITSLIDDGTITEIMVNGPEDVFVERKGKIVRVDNIFRDDNHIMHTIDKIIAPLGRRVDESSPMVDARLPDGSRVNIIIPPLAVKGPSLTIRKFSADPFTLEDLISFGTLNQNMAKLLKACVAGRINILVAGGTGSGKTTLLDVVSGFIPNTERIVTIEDAAELQLQQDHVVTLESRPANIEGKGQIGIRELVINSLRMRPDRIIVGEVRGGEALDMLQAMNTGHDGSLTTVHSNGPRDSLSRLETMVMMSGMDLPTRAIREQVSSAIDLIIFASRFSDGSRKIENISEITGMEGDIITMQDLYVFRHDGFDEGGSVIGRHQATGIVPSFIDKLAAYGVTLPPSIFAKDRVD